MKSGTFANDVPGGHWEKLRTSVGHRETLRCRMPPMHAIAMKTTVRWMLAALLTLPAIAAAQTTFICEGNGRECRR